MIKNYRFSDLQGTINHDALEEWAESYFQSLMGLLNTFFNKVDPAVVAERLEAVPVEDLVKEQLEDELEPVQARAIELVRELLADEVDYYKAYANYQP
ncbi:MAG: hypothetical protein ACM3QZ_12620 [Solirubrobacterales bacterium]